MSPKRATFPRSHRLGGRLEFARVFEAKVRQARGPLMVYARPNDKGHHRIGITIGRRVGAATQRNRIKRLLREAYRLSRHDLPGAYDWVIVVRPHTALSLADYQKLLCDLAAGLHRKWQNHAPTAPGQAPA